MKNSFYRYLTLLFLTLAYSALFAQETEKDRNAIIATVDSFFAAMHSGDSAAMSQIMSPSLILSTVSDGKTTSTPYGTFLIAIAMKPRTNSWFEKLFTYEIKTDADLGTAWTEYSFFVDGKLSHCGVNHFVLTRDKNSNWKIQMIIDSRRTSSCLLITDDRNEIEKLAIEKLLNNWHKAAASADESVFFDSSMTADAIYLGTDITERWLRDELKSWSKSAFDRDVAWDFSPTRRTVYFNDNDPLIAWFEEDLDTWMGACRGSGVLMKIEGQWKIKHYNLAVAVPNDVVEKYLKIINVNKKRG